MAQQGFSGWGDMAGYAAQGFRDAAGAAPASYTAPSLSPFSSASAASVSGVPMMSAAALLRDRKAFADPYLQDVVDTSLTGYDQQAGMTRAAQAANAARNGAFGGSRYGIREALTEGELARQRAGLEAGLRSNAWNTSMGYSQGMNFQNQQTALQKALADAEMKTRVSIANSQGQNALALNQAQLQAQQGLTNAQLQEAQRARQLQALSLLSDTANLTAGNDRADLSLIADLGAQERQIAREEAMAPATHLGLEGQFYGNIPVGTFTGQTVDSTGTSATTQSGGLLGSILGNLASGFSFKI